MVLVLRLQWNKQSKQKVLESTSIQEPRDYVILENERN